MNKTNQLKRVKSRKLEDWVSSNWKKLRRRRPEIEKIAEEASEELSFNVTALNVRSAAETMELRWIRARKKRKVAYGRRQQQLRPIVVSMVGVCTKVCERLDLPIPEEFDLESRPRGQRYRYEPVLKEIAKLLNEIAPLFDIDDLPQEIKSLLEEDAEITK